MRACIAGLGFLLALTSPAAAWWDMGHMEVAAIAYGRLKPDVQKKVDELVRHHLAYSRWTKGLENLSDEEIAQAAFVRAATWADEIKGPLSCQTSGVPGCYVGGPEDDVNGPKAAQNIGTVDHFMHAYWHYYDIPFSTDGTETKPAPPVSALSEIRLLTAALADQRTREDVKSYDLVWLLHLVGDAHQPLHAVSRFAKDMPAGDDGGNKEFVITGEVEPVKLHAFWDGLLGDRGPPSAAIAAASTLPLADPLLASEADPEQWFKESAALARQYAYTPAINPNAQPSQLSAQYVADAKNTAQRQVSLAGFRLANLINRALQ
ncbi:S1/P1 nuclease [Rhizobium leguminosarum]|uniref:S1/P1 nuclease n=1 Tax=Rhizobium leguminosarum TaxID=384 RepID=UPI000477F985|nr:S1/P1 nuclease [Rhizobium leguminosarum]